MFIFASIAFRVESPGTVDLQIFSYIRRYFPESFRAEAIRLGNSAAYDRNFSQALSKDPSAVRRFQKPPLPFTFRFPVQPASAGGATANELVLNIAGAAVNDIDCYICAVSRLFSSLRASYGIDLRIEKTTTIAADGTAHDLGRDYRDVSLINGDDLLPPVWPVTAVQLDFISPLRLVRDRETLHGLNFSDYIRPLMRRISSLAFYYCGIEYDLDFQRLAADSLQVSTADRLLVWTKSAGAVSGVQGRVMFSGELQEYLRFIVLGERFNLGKGASYGMGSYTVSMVR